MVTDANTPPHASAWFNGPKAWTMQAQRHRSDRLGYHDTNIEV